MKVDFQVLCLQVGGSRTISEVQVRVCYWQRSVSFYLSSSQVCVGGCCVLKLCTFLVLIFLVLMLHP